MSALIAHQVGLLTAMRAHPDARYAVANPFVVASAHRPDYWRLLVLSHQTLFPLIHLTNSITKIYELGYRLLFHRHRLFTIPVTISR
jgi:hypothetical protein